MTSLWCLHGNLQLPSVWDPFDKKFSLPESSHHIPLRKVNLWESNPTDFREWAAYFCRHVREENGDDPPLLMGYSLGGRLAFHGVLENPAMWRAAIIIAAHPVLSDPDERKRRLQQDQSWAERFRREPWDQLIRDWDAQPVFGGIPAPGPRREPDFDREKITRLFDVFSVGRQEPLTEKLRKLQNPPILFISGELDKKYREIGEKLARRVPVLQHMVIQNAGHRVPWENPEAFAASVQRFIDTL